MILSTRLQTLIAVLVILVFLSGCENFNKIHIEGKAVVEGHTYIVLAVDNSILRYTILHDPSCRRRDLLAL